MDSVEQLPKDSWGIIHNLASSGEEEEEEEEEQGFAKQNAAALAKYDARTRKRKRPTFGKPKLQLGMKEEKYAGADSALHHFHVCHARIKSTNGSLS